MNLAGNYRRTTFVCAALLFLCGITGLAMPQMAAAAEPGCVAAPPGLTHWWPGDGNTDDIENGNHGTLQNGAGFAAGEVAQGFSLDGVDDYVSIPDAASFTTSMLTLDSWVQPNGLGSYQTIVSKYHFDDSNGQITDDSWLLFAEPDGRVSFVVYGTAGQSHRGATTASPVLTPEIWTFVAATFDIQTQEPKIYINGVESATALYAGSSLITEVNDSSAPVRIGTDYTRHLGDFWAGNIDELEFFNRVVSAPEIQEIFEAGSAGKCKTSSPSAELAVAVTESADPVALGDTYTYLTTVTNNGPDPASSVQTGTTVSGAANTIVSATPSQGSCTIIAAVVNCAIGSLANGGTATVTITVEPGGAGTMAATSVVSATEPDLNGTNNAATESTAINNGHGCTITGTAGNDTIYGTGGNDVICALAGNDYVDGGNGDDTIYGGTGNDNLNGGNGNDTIYAGNSGSTISGGNGNDTVNGGDGADIIYGGNGDDALIGGAGNDTIYGDNGNDNIIAGSGTDTINGGNGNDTCTVDSGDSTNSC
jgi:Ca2+-binding RTX toxin-like protein